MCAVKKIPVPSTLCGGCAKRPATKGSKGIDSLMMRSRNSFLPLYQVIRQVKQITPINNGYQPPSFNLIKVAVQNAKSMIKKAVIKPVITTGLRCHSRRITIAKRMVVINMVVVTDIP